MSEPDSRGRLARDLKRWLQANHGELLRAPGSEVRTPVETTDEPAESTEENIPAANEERSSQEELDELREEATECTRCGLHENRTQVVFDDGDARAQVMVIGEGPGAREDEQGVPFVGPSGELLRVTFEKVGLEEQDIYITNTVKCRPPNNRDPKSEELSACQPYLDQQVELIDPPVVLTLGSFAMEYCLGSDHRISQIRGEAKTWKGRDLVPTFHPGYILRNQSAAEDFLRDVHRAKQLVDHGQ